MTSYRVELTGEYREVYIVEADSADEARDNWMNGDLLIGEAFGMDVDSVQEDDD